MKNKLLIATPYFFPRIGGMENYAYNLALELQAQGWNIVVVCGDTKVRHVTKENLAGLTVYRLPIWKVVSNTPLDPRWYWYLRRIIKTERPAVINAHTPVPFMVDMAALAAGKTPLVVTYHAATLFKPGGLVMTLITRTYLAVQKLTLRKAIRIIAVSDYVKAALGPSYATKTEVVFNAVATAQPARHTAGEGLVFVANLEPSHVWKGLGLILKAIAKVRATTGTAPHLTVIGDGAARPDYEQVVNELGIADYVTFAGRKIGQERDSLMHRAAALVAYPTTANDAFPTVFLEAWSGGLAIIAAAIGPIPSLIQNNQNGILVAPNDPSALAQAIVRFEQNPSAAQAMGEAGRKLIASTFNWPVQARHMAKILEALL